MHMKRSIALTVVAALSQTMAAFAGPPETKQVVVPPPPPPVSYFRPNEFDIGAFATWAKFTNSNLPNGGLHGWGGGMDFTYWFPWEICRCQIPGDGVKFQWWWRSTNRNCSCSRVQTCNRYRWRRQCSSGGDQRGRIVEIAVG